MKKIYILFIILAIGFSSFAQCPCSLSDGTWTNNDFMGQNPTLSATGTNWSLSSAAWISTEETIGADCVLSDGTWTNNDFMGQNPILSGTGTNWSLSSAVWISTQEIDNGDGTTANSVVYGADSGNSSTLVSDCYTGVVSVSIDYTTDSNGDIVGDISFSISSNDGLNFSSTSSITGIDASGPTLTATGDITGGSSGQGTTLNSFVYGADGTNTSILTTDCFIGEVSVSIDYTTSDATDLIIGAIMFSVVSEDNLFSFSSTSSITGIDATGPTLTATGDITGCDNTAIEEDNIGNKNLIKTINILGRSVNRIGEKSLLIYLYDDGSVEKKQQIY